MSETDPTPGKQNQPTSENEKVDHHNPRVILAGDPGVRKIVAEELLAAISREDLGIQQRARQLFIEHGYFDEAVRHLREAPSASERATAAHTLGEFRSDLAIAPLNAALFDNEEEVRIAAELALNRIAQHRLSDHAGRQTEDGCQDSNPQAMLSPDESATEGEREQPSDKIEPPVQGETIETTELAGLLAQEDELRRTLERVEVQLLELNSALESARQEGQVATDRALKLRLELDELRQQDEEVRTKIGVTTERYEFELEKKAVAEQDCKRFADELTHVRTEADHLSESLLHLSKRRAEISAARRAEAEEARRTADEVYHVELKRLKSEEAALRAAAEKAALRRSQVEQARKSIEQQTVRLLDQQAAMGAPEAGRLAAVEQLHQEAEERHKAEREQLQLEIEKLQRMNEEVAARRASVEVAIHESSALEEQINRDIERLGEAEVDARSRIEQAELRRRTAEEACRQLEEKAVKVMAEAHRSALEEEQAITKLETARQEATAELQRRAEQQKRIREEIEQLRKQELEERRRIEEESLRRTQAEATLQQERDRFKAEDAARVKVELEHKQLIEQSRSEEDANTQLEDAPNHPIRRVDSNENGGSPVVVEPVFDTSAKVRISQEVPNTIVDQLKSEHPEERAAALNDLAQIGSSKALPVVIQAFDDESSVVRNAAALALHRMEVASSAESFTRAFEEASAERREHIGLAIVESGLAGELIDSLGSDTREGTYNALSLLLVMARAGQVQPLVQAIEEHDDLEIRRAAIRLLTISGQSELADAAVKRRLKKN